MPRLKCEPFERNYSDQGCDVICFEKNLIYILEIKQCTFNTSDANKAVKQLEYTEQWIKENHESLKMDNISKVKIAKVFIHDKRSGCKTIRQALMKLRREDINYKKMGDDELTTSAYNTYKQIINNME
ncbi:MAG TPA: hypothetical protein ENF43_01630 [Thermoplasmatales archaeon]|nr:hypothetical protein [Thermoplasmatales archaeon]